VSSAATVLIIEDDQDVRETLVEELRAEGFAVMSAASGAEAIELLGSTRHPCAIIVDLLMPGIVGQEILEYLQSEERLAAIPVAVISASPGLAPSGYRVFPKPLDLTSLIEFVREGCPVHPPSPSTSIH
jgi:CheY-like chemotaxis protein